MNVDVYYIKMVGPKMEYRNIFVLNVKKHILKLQELLYIKNCLFKSEKI